MTSAAFKQAVADNKPPENVSVYLKALWLDATGAWQDAHELIQDLPDRSAAWIHAYLHRKEGDLWNADYWYARAAHKRPLLSLADEWEQLIKAMLVNQSSLP